MTRHDLHVALLIAAVVAVIGVAVGYGAGVLSRAAGAGGAPPADGQTVQYDGSPVADRAGRTGTGVPGWQDLYVNDYADLLDPDAEARVRGDLVELYDRTGIEMTVLTIGSMRDHGHDGAIEPFSTATFTAWSFIDCRCSWVITL